MPPTMSVHAFRLDPRRLHAAFAPRRPRHPLARLAIGLLGIGVLVLLVFFGVFVGIGMLTVGLLYRLFRHRGKPALVGGGARPLGGRAVDRHAVDPRVVDGEYRIVPKNALPSA